MDQITIRWLGKVMFLSFVFLQLALFTRNTGNYQDLDEVEMDFRQFSEEQAGRRGRGIPEERFGDRRIRSFPDETEGDKKLHFRHSGWCWSCFTTMYIPAFNLLRFACAFTRTFDASKGNCDA